MQRRPDLYPPPSPNCPHVLTYSPERWENWTPKSWNYIPFNGGPRICIGQQFALTEMGEFLLLFCDTSFKTSDCLRFWGARVHNHENLAAF